MSATYVVHKAVASADAVVGVVCRRETRLEGTSIDVTRQRVLSDDCMAVTCKTSARNLSL